MVDDDWSLKGKGFSLLNGETLTAYETAYLYEEKILDILRLKLIEDLDSLSGMDRIMSRDDVERIINKRFGV